MMMPKFISCYQGICFVAGAPILPLQAAVRQDEKLQDLAGSFLGLNKALVSLSLPQLWEVGGFAVALQPKQVLEIPAGYLIAETNLSDKSVSISWNSFRAEASHLDWEAHIAAAQDLVEADLALASDDSKPRPADLPDLASESSRSYLNKVKIQLLIAHKIRQWGVACLEHVPKSCFGVQWSFAESEQMDITIREMYGKFNNDEKFAKKVPILN